MSNETPVDVAPKPLPSPIVKVWNLIKKGLGFMWEQWFVIGIGVVIALANSFPNVARQGGIIKSQYTIKYLLVAIIFFISGLSLPLQNLYKRGRDWQLHAATHLTSFFVFPTVVFAIVSCVKAADPNFQTFDKYAMVGMVVMGVLPTTVSSNVVMTGQAGGDQSAATIEVMIGNLIGTFLSPALLQMFLSAPGWAFGKPVASGSSGTTEIYRQVIEQLGFTVFIPLFVGEVIQYIWPKQVKWFRTNLPHPQFPLSKVGSLCLLGVIWETFSGAFYTGAFKRLSGQTVAMVVTVNLGLYIVFSLLLFMLARKIPVLGPKAKHVVNGEEIVEREKGPLFDGPTTVALLFCGAAKGIVLGGPIVSILYGGLDAVDAAEVSIPLVLYQGTQVVSGQVTVAILKAWMSRIKRQEAEKQKLFESRSPALASPGAGGEAKTVDTELAPTAGQKGSLEGQRSESSTKAEGDSGVSSDREKDVEKAS